LDAAVASDTVKITVRVNRPLSIVPNAVACGFICIVIVTGAGMPDGLFSNQKSQFGQILEGLAMETVCIFYVHFTAILNILWLFGIFCGHLVCFPRFRMLCQEKSGNPA
jgi:hypothetical protein